MTQYLIVPADGEEVQCHFTIPRPGNRKDLQFTVRRMDFIDDFDTKIVEWASDRMTPVPVLDATGDQVLDDDGQPVTEKPDDISDREAILAQLRIAGVPAATLKTLDTLTNGELGQIHRNWRTESTKEIPVQYYDPETKETAQ